MPFPRSASRRQSKAKKWGSGPEEQRAGSRGAALCLRESPVSAARHCVASAKSLNLSDPHREVGPEYLGVISGKVDTLAWPPFPRECVVGTERLGTWGRLRKEPREGHWEGANREWAASSSGLLSTYPSTSLTGFCCHCFHMAPVKV